MVDIISKKKNAKVCFRISDELNEQYLVNKQRLKAQALDSTIDAEFQKWFAKINKDLTNKLDGIDNKTVAKEHKIVNMNVEKAE